MKKLTGLDVKKGVGALGFVALGAFLWQCGVEVSKEQVPQHVAAVHVYSGKVNHEALKVSEASVHDILEELMSKADDGEKGAIQEYMATAQYRIAISEAFLVRRDIDAKGYFQAYDNIKSYDETLLSTVLDIAEKAGSKYRKAVIDLNEKQQNLHLDMHIRMYRDEMWKQTNTEAMEAIRETTDTLEKIAHSAGSENRRQIFRMFFFMTQENIFLSEKVKRGEVLKDVDVFMIGNLQKVYTDELQGIKALDMSTGEVAVVQKPLVFCRALLACDPLTRSKLLEVVKKLHEKNREKYDAINARQRSADAPMIPTPKGFMEKVEESALSDRVYSNAGKRIILDRHVSRGMV